MINIRSIELKQLKESNRYKLIENGIYQDLEDEYDYADHRMGLTFEIEEGEDSQYPLEDLFDKYFIHIEEFIEEKDNVYKAIIGGNLNNLTEIKSVFGKRVYNEDYLDKAGQTRVKLIIE